MTPKAYRIRFHPEAARDLATVADWIAAYSGLAAADRKLAEIAMVIDGLSRLPHRGSRRDEVAPGLRAVPAGRKAVVTFAVDDAEAEVLIYAISYGGADWMARSRSRT